MNSAGKMTFEFKLPDIGEGIAECEIGGWRVKVGDRILEDQPLVDMLTDKAAVEIPSPVAGRVKELRGEAGDKVAVGSVLLVIDISAGAAGTANIGAGAAKTAAERHVADPMSSDENIAPVPIAVTPSRTPDSANAPAAKSPAVGGGSFQFKLPDIGEGIAECEIGGWRVAVGDAIAEDQPLVDMLTDKAAVEIPSPVAGVVRELRGAAGDKVAVGAVLLVIETGAAVVPAASPSAAALAPVTQRPPASTAPAASPHPAGEKPLAAPSVRKRARELGIDLHQVPGSKRGGRIGHEDLDRHRTSPQPSASSPGPAARPLLPGTDRIDAVKIIGLRRKIAESMERSKRRIPHFAYVEEVDVTELEALRVHLNATKRAEQPKLTLLPFLMHALVKAVPEFPDVNGTYDDEAGVFHRHTALHVGIAAQTPNGLVVPVAKHAEALDLWAGAAEIKRLADAAKTGKAKRDELSGSTITITSLGTLGGIVSTPVINAPEVAIIGVNKMVERPVVRSGQIAVRTMMNLSSSFDHRIVDGWVAASFIQRLKQLLEHPATIFMPVT